MPGSKPPNCCQINPHLLSQWQQINTHFLPQWQQINTQLLPQWQHINTLALSSAPCSWLFSGPLDIPFHMGGHFTTSATTHPPHGSYLITVAPPTNLSPSIQSAFPCRHIRPATGYLGTKTWLTCFSPCWLPPSSLVVWLWYNNHGAKSLVRRPATHSTDASDSSIGSAPSSAILVRLFSLLTLLSDRLYDSRCLDKFLDSAALSLQWNWRDTDCACMPGPF